MPTKWALVDAAGKGDVKLVQKLLTNKNVNVNYVRREHGGGQPALFMAALNGHVRVAQILIGAGANVDLTQTPTMATPLNAAAQVNSVEIVQMLIAAGANVNLARDNRVTPIFMAAQHDRLPIVKLLIDAGADVDFEGSVDMASPIFQAAALGYAQVTEALIAAGANVDVARPKDGATPLGCSAEKGFLPIVRALLAGGADVDKGQANGKTPLYKAAIQNKLEVVRVLIAAGAEVNKATPEGLTPLLRSVEGGYVQVTEALIAGAADVNLASVPDGITPVFASAQFHRLEVMHVLIAAGADLDKANLGGCTPLCIAAHYGKLPIVRALLAAGADLHKADVKGWTPLTVAAHEGNLAAARVLVAAGADVNVPLPPNDPEAQAMPLLVAVRHGLMQIFPLLPPVLQENGADDEKVLAFLQQKEQDVQGSANRGDIEYVRGEGGGGGRRRPAAAEAGCRGGRAKQRAQGRKDFGGSGLRSERASDASARAKRARRRHVLLRRKQTRSASARKECPPAEAGCGASERSEHEEGIPSAAETDSLSERKEGVSFCDGSGLRSERPSERSEHEEVISFCGGNRLAQRAQRRRVLLRRKRAASLGGCRGETPRTPPAAGKIAHALNRTCAQSHMRSIAHALNRACARSHAHALVFAAGGPNYLFLSARFARRYPHLHAVLAIPAEAVRAFVETRAVSGAAPSPCGRKGGRGRGGIEIAG
jgi:ankyrin repeat protein